MNARERVADLLNGDVRTYAEQAGIRLADRPAPLYQLLVLSLMLSTRISADIAVAAARELHAAGYMTPSRMREARWQDRVDALGRARYRRYDESTATRLGDGAQLLRDRYRDDLRRLARGADCDVRRAKQELQDFPGIGPVGADIFLREVQRIWSWVQPYADARVATGAKRLGLPATADRLAELAGTTDLSRLSAAIIDVTRGRKSRVAPRS